MKTTSALLCVLTCLFVGCSDASRQNTGETFGPEELAAREAKLEQLILKVEETVGPDYVKELKKSHEAYKEARTEQEKALPELTKSKDYYRLQCEYTDSLIRMLEVADSESTD